MELWRGQLLVAVAVLMTIVGEGEAQLRPNFYRRTCPFVEQIVRQAVMEKVRQTFVTVPATLRVFFHDCFVEGCDASILIQSPKGDAEKDADDNLSLAGDGFDAVTRAKQAVEAACPGVVSCADILVLAARDVVALSGGPRFIVELGRRDGLISSKSRVSGNIPLPSFNLDLLTELFQKNNLTMTDMIALSGAHTIGFSHCNRFTDRLYSSSGVDPSLNATYARQLMQACPRNVDARVAVTMDSTSTRFDNAYFRNLVSGMGLFTSDQVLFTDPRSRPTVTEFASNPLSFARAFASAMVQLGRTGVRTGNQGVIRRDCSIFN